MLVKRLLQEQNPYILKYVIVILFSCSICIASAQNIYGKGDFINNFTSHKLLNYTSSTSDLNTLKSEITILDFFGTWCVPCIKALPALSGLQKKFAGKLQVILISVEEQSRLDNFIKKRPGFTFPVMLDTDKAITSLFNPPSYPYTVVMDAKNKIIAITDAASITENMVTDWLKEKQESILEKPGIKEKDLPATLNISMSSKEHSSNTIVLLSQDLMYAAKTGEPTQIFEDKMNLLNYNTLIAALKSDDEKKSFWINIYNGFTQVLLKKNPGAYKNRNKFFGAKQIHIAQKSFSLDEVEHGILRRSKIKWSLGYLNKLFPSKIEKELRVQKLDYRIHFALNCGAKSCPPIAFYDFEKLSNQLDMAAKTYLVGETKYDSSKNILYLPALMGWFRRDFGGKKKMIMLVKKLAIISEETNPKIKFNKYNWNLFLQNYQTNTNE